MSNKAEGGTAHGRHLNESKQQIGTGSFGEETRLSEFS